MENILFALTFPCSIELTFYNDIVVAIGSLDITAGCAIYLVVSLDHRASSCIFKGSALGQYDCVTTERLIVSHLAVSTNEDGYTLNLLACKVKLVLVLDNVSVCWIVLIENQISSTIELLDYIWLCWEPRHCSYEVCS